MSTLAWLVAIPYPVLILIVICVFFLLLLLLIFVAFSPEAADRIIHVLEIIQDQRKYAYRSRRSHKGRKIQK